MCIIGIGTEAIKMLEFNRENFFGRWITNINIVLEKCVGFLWPDSYFSKGEYYMAALLWWYMLRLVWFRQKICLWLLNIKIKQVSCVFLNCSVFYSFFTSCSNLLLFHTKNLYFKLVLISHFPLIHNFLMVWVLSSIPLADHKMNKRPEGDESGQ